MFTEANSVEYLVRDLLKGVGWEYLPPEALARSTSDVLVEEHLRDALIRLNPEIAKKPDRADEVIYKLRAIILTVQTDGLVRANEEFASWLCGERSMPFGINNEHVPVRLIDFDNIKNNRFVVTTQYSFTAGQNRIPDLALLVNGIPLVIGEGKTPVRPAISWVDGAIQIHDDYEVNIPALFVPNIFSFATEGKTYRYGSIRAPIDIWSPWRDAENNTISSLSEVRIAVQKMLRPDVVLDILENFTVFATDKKKRKIKIITRFQQYDAANKIVERVLNGRPKKGLIWHFQGSGKSLLMVFAAQKLRMHPALKSPTVIIVVDRIDLDTQITATFNASDIPNTVPATTREELQNFLLRDMRKIIITTIHKFAEAGYLFSWKDIQGKDRERLTDFLQSKYDLEWVKAAKISETNNGKTIMITAGKNSLSLNLNNKNTEMNLKIDSGKTDKFVVKTENEKLNIYEAGGVLNDRDNIIVLVDEAHRTQEGDLGIKMREALPNAFLFGLTGTPINKRDRNTFWAFGAEEDTQGYMSRYTFEESIRDNATLPLHFEPRLVESHVDQKSMDEAFANITDILTDEDKAELSKKAGKMATFIQTPERINKISLDIVEHYHSKVEPNGFKAMVVCFDRKSCVLYKEALDKQLPQEASDIVMTLARGDDSEWKKKWDRNKDEEERILDRFRDQSDPLKILIVTSKLLTGFDAPILQTMYLDKLMKDHTLLQAVCRTNRPFPQKTHGLIVDYIGVFDDVAKSLTFDLKTIQRVITNISELRNKLPDAMRTCLAYFPKVDKTISGYEGLMAAQDCLPNNETRDKFAADYSYLSRLWEAISPDPILRGYKEDYRWLTQVYESVQPASGNGKLLWHSLGAKTIEIINENVHVDAIRDDLDKIVLDEEMIQSILSKDNPKKAKEIEIKIIKRLSKHKGNPKFIELGERLEELREKYELGFLTSLDFLNKLLNLARDLVEAEREVEPEDERKKVKAALTELFQQVKNDKTPIMVERIVNDIDDVVRIVRFDGWQWTNAGEREVKQALRKTLLKYKLHKEQDLFERAYAYIREYY